MRRDRLVLRWENLRCRVELHGPLDDGMGHA